MSTRSPVRLLVALLASALLIPGCSLTEVTTTAAEDIVVVEALLQRRDDLGFVPSRLRVFMHRTIQGDQGLNARVDSAEVLLILESGDTIEVPQVFVSGCVVSTPVQGAGSCYVTGSADTRSVQPGEAVRLEIRTAEGEFMEATSVLPGTFEVLTAEDGDFCRVEPNDPLEIHWTRSEGAWAYVNETQIANLPEALGNPEGVDIPDPLDLLGLSISATDTTIVFPGEFGIFDRTDLDQPLALALQSGLPMGARATVDISAVDRNYVNWVRGGNFNPSGQVRVPSIRGDGTGYFGSGVVRTFDVRTEGVRRLCSRFGER